MKIERDERRFDFHDIGLAIKRAREAAGMTQEQLAYIVDRAPRTIMYNENDGQHPSLNTFYQMVTMFDISVLVQRKRLLSRAHPGGCRSVGSAGLWLHGIRAAADHGRAFQRQADRRHHVRRAFYLVWAFHCAARRQGRKDPRRRSSQPDAERTELGAVHYSE